MEAWLQGFLCGNSCQTQTQLLKTCPKLFHPITFFGVALGVCKSCCDEFWAFGKMGRCTPVGEAG